MHPAFNHYKPHRVIISCSFKCCLSLMSCCTGRIVCNIDQLLIGYYVLLFSIDFVSLRICDVVKADDLSLLSI